MRGTIRTIGYETARDFLLPKHYSGRTPSISYSFGHYIGGELMAVCTFGKPASNSLCVGVCGEEYSSKVYELNRLCRKDEYNEQISSFVAACLRRLSPKNLIIVSYADTGMNHNGYIYQATNFIYTGKTRERTDKYTEGNKHSRHYNEENQHLRKVRTSKHRYVFFCANKKLKRKYKDSLKYGIQPYPKLKNENYKLGDIQKTKVINKETGEIFYV